MSFPNTKDFDDVSQGLTWIRIQVKYANPCCNPECQKWIEENEPAYWRKGTGIMCIDHMPRTESWRTRSRVRDFDDYVRSKQKSTPELIAALSITNEMRKYEAIRKYGIEKLIDELDANHIDTSKRGNQLFEADLFEPSNAKILRYTDPSTGEVYANFVPEEVDTADAAMAWKFYLTEEEYDGLTEEG